MENENRNIEIEENEEIKSVTWTVTFDLTINGRDGRWDELSEADQEYILNSIKDAGCPGNSCWGMW